MTAPAPRTFKDAEARLAISLPGYESRVPQQNLANLVEQGLDAGRHVIAEAGCGTGKSLGALIPAILWAKQEKKRVVYSTATKALQEQVFGKDLPFLAEHLGVKFNYALLKGRGNYFCRAKAIQADPRMRLRLETELEQDPRHDGDREHFATPTTDMQWREFSATKDECPGKKKCPFGASCFAEFAKARAQTSEVVVVNHALTFVDAKIRMATDGWASMLGAYDALIMDEAHEIEEIATNAMADTLGQAGLRRLATEASNFCADWQIPMPEQVGNRIIAASARLWSEFPEVKGKDRNTRLNLPWWVEHFEPAVDLIDALRDMADLVGGIDVQGEDAEGHRGRLVRRGQSYASILADLATADDLTLVRWIEKAEDGKGTIYVKSAPLRVGPWLTAGIWSNTPTTLISATMSVGGDFGYIIDRLSLPDPLSMNVGTPFNFRTQALTFVPESSMPSPKEAGWATTTPVLTSELVKAAGGGALLLFTSKASMKAAYERLAPEFKALGINSFLQGGDDGTNKEIARKFEADEHSCLFALKSFFTGVDFQGNTCRLVVLDKLPFPVPTDTMFAARSAEVERNGGSAFSKMSLPAMTLTLLQAYGRLIRHKSDRGVVAVLDSRLSSSGWGRNIVKNMPNAPVTTDLDEVRRFFA